MYTLAPSNFLVRNTGVEDGTGNHTCRWTSNIFSEQDIEKHAYFDYQIKTPLGEINKNETTTDGAPCPEGRRA